MGKTTQPLPPSPAPALAPLLGLPGARLARCMAERGEEGAVWRSLASSLKLRTLQSLVKKVNRTLARRAALRRLAGGGGGQLDHLEVEDTPPHLARRGPAPDLLTRRPPPLPADIRELFSPSLCTFGFAAHLFAQETESSISALPPPPASAASSTVFCLAGDLALVEQVRRLDTLYCTVLYYTVLHCTAGAEAGHAGAAPGPGPAVAVLDPGPADGPVQVRQRTPGLSFTPGYRISLAIDNHHIYNSTHILL